MKLEIQKLIVDVPRLKPQGAVLVGIDGCGGSGKSTAAEQLADALGNAQVIHVDDFYKPRERRIKITEQTPVHINFEFERLKQECLKPLINGSVASHQALNGEVLEIQPSGYVIVEGLGTLGAELSRYFDYKIWVDSPEDVRRQRGIKRDSVEWTKIWDNEYLPQDARYVKEQAPQNEADWILHNN